MMLAQISRYSFLIALALLAVVIIMQTWARPKLRLVGLAVAALIIGAWWLLRPGAGGSAGANTLASALSSGQPVVVEVYSDY